MNSSFSIEIILDQMGVRSVRVLGTDWEHSADAHALLQRLSPLIQQLDAQAKRDMPSRLGQSGRGIQ
jgi:hypothetical protein